MDNTFGTLCLQRRPEAMGQQNFVTTKQIGAIQKPVSTRNSNRQRTTASRRRTGIRRQRSLATKRGGLSQSIERQKLGTVKPFEVFQSQQFYLQAQIDYLQAVADYNKAQFALRVAQGEILWMIELRIKLSSIQKYSVRISPESRLNNKPDCFTRGGVNISV